MAVLARFPSPHTWTGWVRVLVLWILVSALMKHPLNPTATEAFWEAVVGWFPLLLIVCALARLSVRRRGRRSA